MSTVNGVYIQEENGIEIYNKTYHGQTFAHASPGCGDGERSDYPAHETMIVDITQVQRYMKGSMQALRSGGGFSTEK